MSPGVATETVGERATRHVNRRLMPFLLVLYFVAYLDRVNLGYAGLEMTRELGFSNEIFGFGAGIFFFGYVLLEIPGTLLVERWSARKWIARIMISWGIVASLTGLIHNAQQFYWIRFLLGVAEAGFFPGIIVYLTHWYRYEDRGKAIALFMTAVPVSNVIGAPISGLLMKIGWMGLSGWRWLLILEGAPALILGVVTLFYLTDRPKDARWLSAEERNWLTHELEQEKRVKKAARPITVWQALRHRDVIVLTLVYFLIEIGVYGMNFFLPKIIQKLSGLSTFQITLLSAIPYLTAVPAMLLVGWNSDRTGERKWHTSVSMWTFGVCLALSQLAGGSVAVSVALFSVAVAGLMAMLPGFWPLPTTFLTESAAAASIGLINSLGNLGGFLGPYLIGMLSTRTGSYLSGALCIAGSAVLGGTLVHVLRGEKNLSPQEGHSRGA